MKRRDKYLHMYNNNSSKIYKKTTSISLYDRIDISSSSREVLSVHMVDEVVEVGVQLGKLVLEVVHNKEVWRVREVGEQMVVDDDGEAVDDDGDDDDDACFHEL